MTNPRLAGVLLRHDLGGVQSIVVVPIRWRATVIGATILQTERGGHNFPTATFGSARSSHL